MNPMIRLLAKSPWTWRLWMTLGTPFVASAFAVALAHETYVSIRASWRYDFSHQWRAWIESFGEQHRLSLSKMREVGGTLMRLPHVRHADDVQ